MTTITIDNPSIERKYNSYELKMQFMSFLEREIWDDSLELYEISINDLPSDVLNSYKNMNTIDFIQR